MRVVKVVEGAPYAITVGGSYGVTFTKQELEDVGLINQQPISPLQENVFMIKYSGVDHHAQKFFLLEKVFLEDCAEISAFSALKYSQASQIQIGDLTFDQIEYLKLMALKKNTHPFTQKIPEINYEDVEL